MSIYYLCATQPYNLGDLVINKVLIKELSKYSNLYLDTYNTPSVFSDHIYDNNRIINIFEECNLSLKNWSIFKTIRFIRRNKIKFFFMSPGPMSSRLCINNVAILVIFIMLKLMRVKIYRVGNDCNEDDINKPLLKIYNLVVDQYYLRSHNIVNKLNDNYPLKASYIPDLALLELEESVNLSKDNKVAVTFRPILDDTELFKYQCITQIEYFASLNYDVYLYYQVETDREFMSDLYNMINKKNVYYINKIIWYDDIAFFNDVDFIVSNRLHSLLLGAIKRAIPLAFIPQYNKKINKVHNVFKALFADNADKYLVNYHDNILIEGRNIKQEQDYIYETMRSNKQLIINIINNIFTKG